MTTAKNDVFIGLQYGNFYLVEKWTFGAGKNKNLVGWVFGRGTFLGGWWTNFRLMGEDVTPSSPK